MSADQLAAIRGARVRRDAAHDRLYALALARLRLDRGPDQEQGDGARRRLDEQLRDQRTAVEHADVAVSQAIAALLGDQPPRDLLSSWEADLPILLMPLRVETRWRVEERELWVRVFPDDIAVVTHEKVLTDAEVTHGRAYWTARQGADADAAGKAWQALANRLGANRAAWVALQTQPTNWEVAGDDPQTALTFPNPRLTKPDSWTAAPHTRVLPDRFVLLGWRGDQRVVEQMGAPVSDVVTLGPSPLDDGSGPSIKRDPADRTLKLGDDFAWVRDFDSAVAAGLAFRLALGVDDVELGFDRLVVIGVKHSAAPDDAKLLVEDLLDNHHYALGGLSVVAQGTPTNNTDGNDSPYSRSGRSGAESGPAEAGPPLFAPTADRSAASDGQRLADFLGIDYAPLLHADGADLTDNAEAVAMNRALYAGTLGYYLDHMLEDVVGDDAQDTVRQHFTEHVTGRGPLPTIRVGNQPYGILPTSSFARWGDGLRHVGIARLFPVSHFELRLYQVLAAADEALSTLVGGVARVGAPGDGAAHLLDVLGLQPTAAEYYQRVGYSWDYLRNLDDFAFGGKYFADVLKKAIEGQAARGLLAELGYDPNFDDGRPKPLPLLLQLIWRHYHTKLDATSLIDGQPLSETKGIAPYDPAHPDNYVDWLRANADNIDALEHEDFGAVAAPTSLLYMMLRWSLLRESERALFRWLSVRAVEADVLVRSRKFMNIGPQPSPSTWEVFRTAASALVTQDAIDKPLLQVVLMPQFSAEEARFLHQQIDALGVLGGMRTARLERALAEHVDTLTYRLDAWQTSLFSRRLHQLRRLDEPPEQRRTGLYLGAYGFLENVHATPDRRAAVPPERRPAGDDGPLYVQTNTGGHVHTPSLNHATAAALLRNGFLTHSTPAEPGALAVNISSERVRRAEYLLEGIRGGQSLEVLLGVQFERGLHDWTTRPVDPVVLDQLKPAFRRKFPIRRTKMPQQADADVGPVIVTEDYSVVNGLDLAITAEVYPYGIAELGGLSAQQQAAILQEREGIADTLDALRDVLTTEAAYQLALGNFDRAAAIVRATGDGTVPPDIEVLRTPRGTGLAFTQRLVVSLDPATAANPWPVIPLTPRATLERALNQWVGSLLGDPATIGCAVSVAGGGEHGTVTLEDLKLQPLDFVYLVRRQVEESGAAELEARVRTRFAEVHAVVDGAVVEIAFADPGTAERSLAEALALGDRVRRLLGTSRPLTARHFHSPSKDGAKTNQDVDLIDLAELTSRVTDVLVDVRALVPPLQAALAAADAAALRNALRALSDAGVPYTLPHSAVGAGPDQLAVLTAQARSVIARATALGTETDDLLARAADATTTIAARVTALVTAVRGWLSDDFVLLPHFELGDPAGVAASHAARAQLLAFATGTAGIALPLREWLHGAACVRPLVHEFELLRLLAEASSEKTLELEPLQLPHRPGDSWLGVEFPSGTDIVHDTISLAQHAPQAFDAAKAQSGLLVDEWVEVVPRREEVTGIAFNFDAPNSAPPQALLLAVAPHQTGHWSFDDLVETVLDTFRRARLRAVEPDEIGDLPAIGTLLPAVMAEFSTGRSTISLDYSLMLIAIREGIAQLSAHVVTP